MRDPVEHDLARRDREDTHEAKREAYVETLVEDQLASAIAIRIERGLLECQNCERFFGHGAHSLQSSYQARMYSEGDDGIEWRCESCFEHLAEARAEERIERESEREPDEA